MTMLEIAHRQEQHQPTATQQQSRFYSSSSSSKAMSSGKSHPTAQDLSVPLQLRPLKAPSSPLATHEPFSAKLASENGLQLSNIGSASTSASSSTSIKSNGRQQKFAGEQKHYIPRIRRGQKIEEIQALEDAPLSLQQIDSPFQLQEYIALLVRHNPHEIERIISLPSASMAGNEDGEKGKERQDEENEGVFMGGNDDNSSGSSEEDPPHIVDTDVWVYEHLRRIVADFTSPWLTALQRECDRKKRPKTCEAMNADDWMYLCASHGEEKQCCAIDYIIHTLDGTTALLNSHRHFPSRTYIPATSLRHFGSVARRLSRIFVHAYEHHRDVYEACEAETSLYARFLALVQHYDLIATDSLPKLTSSNSVESKIAEKETITKSHVDRDEFIGRQSRVNEKHSNRLLYDHGQVKGVPSDASNEEDEEDENIDDEEFSRGANLKRSDSNSSRVTAIHVDVDKQQGANAGEEVEEEEEKEEEEVKEGVES